MGAVSMRVRSELRTRSRALVGLALLIGVVSGAAIGLLDDTQRERELQLRQCLGRAVG